MTIRNSPMRNVLGLLHKGFLKLNLHGVGRLQDGVRAVHKVTRSRIDSVCEAYKDGTGIAHPTTNHNVKAYLGKHPWY